VTAAVLWLRSRKDFYRWSLRFVALSFVGFGLFALIPAAPPWAAAKCTAAQVAGHPYDPPCLSQPDGAYKGNLLGTVTGQHAGVAPYVQRMVGRGFGDLNLRFAAAVIKTGQSRFDVVAAVPSLHAGGIMLFTIFMWPRLNRWWRPVLVAYPLFMAFTLVYSAEHYFTDVLAGWLAAALVCLGANRIERGRKRRTPTDRLDPPSDPPVVIQESEQCPPTSPLPETTPSSTSASDADSFFPPARSTAAPARHGTTARSV
jgi:membrane-associated phospholipid phosphatase